MQSNLVRLSHLASVKFHVPDEPSSASISSAECEEHRACLSPAAKSSLPPLSLPHLPLLLHKQILISTNNINLFTLQRRASFEPPLSLLCLSLCLHTSRTLLSAINTHIQASAHPSQQHKAVLILHFVSSHTDRDVFIKMFIHVHGSAQLSSLTTLLL